MISAEDIDGLGAWETGSGYKTDFFAEVVAAKFATNEWRPDNTDLVLTVVDDEDDEELEVKIGCGKGWEILDDGDSVIHLKTVERQRSYEDRMKAGRTPKRRPKVEGFNEKSFVGRLIQALARPDGVEDDMGIPGMCQVAALLAMARAGIAPTDSRAWIGWKFHFREHTFDFGERAQKNEFGEEVMVKMESSKVFPVACLGRGEEIRDNQHTETVGRGSEVATSGDNSMEALKKMAAMMTAAEFGDEALKMPTVIGSDELLGKLMSGDLYAELRG